MLKTRLKKLQDKLNERLNQAKQEELRKLDDLWLPKLQFVFRKMKVVFKKDERQKISALRKPDGTFDPAKVLKEAEKGFDRKEKEVWEEYQRQQRLIEEGWAKI